MNKGVLVIKCMPLDCVDCAFLYGVDNPFCGGVAHMLKTYTKNERPEFCPLIELPAEIKPEDCEIIERDGCEKFTEEEKELIAAGTAHGWNCLLDILTEGEGSEDED